MKNILSIKMHSVQMRVIRIGRLQSCSELNEYKSEQNAISCLNNFILSNLILKKSYSSGFLCVTLSVLMNALLHHIGKSKCTYYEIFSEIMSFTAHNDDESS